MTATAPCPPAELENHLGIGDKTLAEFIISLSEGNETVPKFSKVLRENGAEMPDSFVGTLLGIIQRMKVCGPPADAKPLRALSWVMFVAVRGVGLTGGADDHGPSRLDLAAPGERCACEADEPDEGHEVCGACSRGLEVRWLLRGAPTDLSCQPPHLSPPSTPTGFSSAAPPQPSS